MKITGNHVYIVCPNCHTEILEPLEVYNKKDKKEVICPICQKKINQKEV